MNMPDIKFWYGPGSCSLVPHVLLHESGLPFTAIEVSISKLETRTDAFSRINPKQRVPVISLDESVITEVPAIATAISQLVPELGLMGKTSIEQVRVMEWMCWLSGELHGQCFGGLFRPERFIDDPNQFDAVQRKARNRIIDCFKAIDSKLSGPFAVGNGLTAVDPYLLVFYRWGSRNSFDMSEQYPKFTAYIQTIVAYPAIVSAMAEDGSIL
jgi:glutathione S-transferase